MVKTRYYVRFEEKTSNGTIRYHDDGITVIDYDNIMTQIKAILNNKPSSWKLVEIRNESYDGTQWDDKGFRHYIKKIQRGL